MGVAEPGNHLVAMGDPPRHLMALLGSGEFEPWAAPVERSVLERASGNGSVVVLATASAPDGESVYRSWIDAGLAHYAAMGVPATAADVRTREDALRCAGAGAIATASMAGAVAWVPAAALLPGALIVPHWNALDAHRWGQRTDILNGHARDRTLLGVDERTAAIAAGGEWQVAGAGRVLIQRGVRWRRFGDGERFDPARALDDPGPLYHRTFDADRIMRHDFTDSVEERRGGRVAHGVWLADRPLDAQDRIAGDAVLAVEIPFDVAAEYEWADGGDRYREFCIPAGILNRYAPFVEVDPRTGPSTSVLPAETG